MQISTDSLTPMLKGKLVYVCSPLRAPSNDGIIRNMEAAADYSNRISSLIGCRAVAPHSFLPKYFDDNVPAERQVCLDFGLSVLKLCAAMFICGNSISSGMQGEINLAKELGIPIFVFKDYAGDIFCGYSHLEEGMEYDG